jgi:ribosomal protein L23
MKKCLHTKAIRQVFLPFLVKKVSTYILKQEGKRIFQKVNPREIDLVKR